MDEEELEALRNQHPLMRAVMRNVATVSHRPGDLECRRAFGQYPRSCKVVVGPAPIQAEERLSCAEAPSHSHAE